MQSKNHGRPKAGYREHIDRSNHYKYMGLPDGVRLCNCKQLTGLKTETTYKETTSKDGITCDHCGCYLVFNVPKRIKGDNEGNFNGGAVISTYGLSEFDEFGSLEAWKSEELG